MVGKIVRWPLGMVVGFLAFVGSAASATYFLREPANTGFREGPPIVIEERTWRNG